MADNVKRQKSYPACGRLIVLQALGDGGILTQISSQENFQGFTAINFPSMPDAIELARKAEYGVSSPYGFPDGIHFYKGTQPLRIPFSFKLHSFDDEYCPEGAKTLLELAATLHALTLPFGPDKFTNTWGSQGQLGAAPNGDSRSLVSNAAESTQLNSKTDTSQIFPPATCYLELVLTDRQSVGIACVGYVEEVKVRIMAPFLKGPDISQNLPTAGEFEFVFVHHPGHGNAFSVSAPSLSFAEQQAFAKTVKDKLYNTVGLLTDPNNFVSFNDSPNGK